MPGEEIINPFLGLMENVMLRFSKNFDPGENDPRLDLELVRTRDRNIFSSKMNLSPFCTL